MFSTFLAFFKPKLGESTYIVESVFAGFLMDIWV